MNPPPIFVQKIETSTPSSIEIPDVPELPDSPELPLEPDEPVLPLDPDDPLVPEVPLLPLVPDVPELPLEPDVIVTLLFLILVPSNIRKSLVVPVVIFVTSILPLVSICNLLVPAV